MKAWTVYLVNNEKVCVFVSGDKEAAEVFKSVYGDNVEMEWLGWARCGVEYDKKLYAGQSPADMLISTGFMKSYYAKSLGLMR